MKLSHRSNPVLRGSSKVDDLELLNFYHDAPQEEISIDEFENFALDRLQLLRGIEILRSRGIGGTEFKTELERLERKLMPLRSHGTSEEDARKDSIAHFILRLAYCKSEDLRRWFLAQESNLFRFRLERLSDDERASFMGQNGLDFELITQQEVNERFHLLSAVPGGQQLKPMTKFFRVPFTQAFDLVASRQVYLEGGFAYVPITRLIPIIVARFRMHVSRSLIQAARSFETVTADPRIGSLLKNMNKQYLGRDYSNQNSEDKLGGKLGGEIRAGDIDDLAPNSFPLCMRQLHHGLKRDHKLRHWGRLQFGLFLKGVGVPLEEALVYWQTEFTRGMSVENFLKQYAYNVRHMYGKEGKRTNYTPYSCTKIILGTPPGQGDHHGCPFRHYDEAHLSALMNKMRVSPQVVDDVMRHKRSGNFQLACLRHFEHDHPEHEAVFSSRENTMGGRVMEGVGNHPNAWFQASRAYYYLKSQETTGGASTSTVGNQKRGFGQMAPLADDGMQASRTTMLQEEEEERGEETKEQV